MPRTSKRMIWVGFALIAGYLIHGTLAEGSANDQVVQEQWQIAILTLTSNRAAPTMVDWQSPDGSVSHPLPQVRHISGKRGNYTGEQAMLDAIGAQGWQPISYVHIGDIERFCFKRRSQTPAP